MHIKARGRTAVDCIDISQFGATPAMPFPLVAANDAGRPAHTPRRRRQKVKIRSLTALD